MALANMEFFSTSLSRSVSFKLILPNDVAGEKSEYFKRPMKLLILLHGYCGFSGDWLYYSDIYALASKYNLAVLLPSGENSFYNNNIATGRKYADFIGKELPAYVCSTFGISDKREDTFIGGLSMGGFGALHTALQFPERISKCIALSSALISDMVSTMEPGFDNGMANYEYYALMFGDPKKLSESDTNPKYLLEKLQEEKKEIPEIFMACGTEDFLFGPNCQMSDYLTEKGVKHTFVKDTGIHDFNFWNKMLEPSIKWALEIK